MTTRRTLSYAVSLTRLDKWGTSVRVLEFLSSQSEGSLNVAVEISRRDIAKWLGISDRTLARALDRLQALRVVELCETGVGTAANRWRVLDPQEWSESVPWALDRREVVLRLDAHFASQVRALETSSARAQARALRLLVRPKSAEQIAPSARAQARALEDAGARAQARALEAENAAPIPLLSRVINNSSLQEEEEVTQSAQKSTGDPRGDELVAAIESGGGGRRLYGDPKKRARYLAQECNGRLSELVAIASDPAGPKFGPTMVELLEETLRRAALQRPEPVRNSGRPTDRTEQIRRDLETAKRIGDPEMIEDLTQALATMES